MDLRLDERVLCEVQGRLFQNSVKEGYQSESFISDFMNSDTAAHLDLDYDRLQWMGEEYLLSELNDEVHGLKKGNEQFSEEMMFWTGYLYRYWHYLTGEDSKKIFEIADADAMSGSWFGFHTMDPEMAVHIFKEECNSSCNKMVG